MANKFQDRYNDLRKNYNVFTFERFEYDQVSNKINIKYTFNLSEKYIFRPNLVINLNALPISNVSQPLLENLIFQVGMIELISYWKAACPPVLKIRPFQLDEEQIYFWKKLYFNGLGEFFYQNKINTSLDDFMTMEFSTRRQFKGQPLATKPDRLIIPVGGGKDSALTLELLNSVGKGIPFMINPRKASIETAALAGYDRRHGIEIQRTIDPLLLELNRQGFLNGHTPFSALIGFLSLIPAAFTRSRFIALSNESSASEPTIQEGPNHQYSKSLEFEEDFRTYCRHNISPDLEYFSFLRPLNELGIAHRFSKYPKYLNVFQSCNVGSKSDRWCGKCPKCLFTAIILRPFVDRKNLNRIFGNDLLDEPELMQTFNELIGLADAKPFECVGTVDEVNVALVHTINNSPEPLPFLLDYYLRSNRYELYKDRRIDGEINIGERHFVPPSFLPLLNVK